MPAPKSSRASPAVDRRDRLTLAKLASYDDVVTDALVDRVGLSPHSTSLKLRLS